MHDVMHAYKIDHQYIFLLENIFENKSNRVILNKKFRKNIFLVHIYFCEILFLVFEVYLIQFGLCSIL